MAKLMAGACKSSWKSSWKCARQSSRHGKADVSALVIRPADLNYFQNVKSFKSSLVTLNHIPNWTSALTSHSQIVIIPRWAIYRETACAD